MMRKTRGEVALWVISLVLASSGPVEARSLQVGYATYYTARSCQAEGTSGRLTASGARFEESQLTAALPSYAFGRWYQVCTRNRAPRRCVIVCHTDYGPGKHAQQRGVIVDLTPVAFQQLAPLDTGRLAITLEELR